MDQKMFILEMCLSTISDTESEDSIDEDDTMQDPPRKIMKTASFVEDICSEYSKKDFHSNFRLKKSIVYGLIGRFHRSQYLPKHTSGSEKVSAEKSILLTLWYLSNTETFRQVADRFEISQSTVHNCLVRVLSFFLSLGSQYIRWPSEEKCEIISEKFETKYGIQDMIGSINTTHIEIAKPKVQSEEYINENQYYSIILQGVVDPDYYFTDVYVGEPGSLQTAEVLRRSSLYRRANDENLFGDRFLIGDSAYPAHNWLVPPFKDTKLLIVDQKNFNRKLLSAKVCVDHAFGKLKGRFRRLKKFDNLNIELCVKCIMVCCILHNVAIIYNDDLVIEIEPTHSTETTCNIVGDVKKQRDVFNAVLASNK